MSGSGPRTRVCIRRRAEPPSGHALPALSDASAARGLVAALAGLRTALGEADTEGVPTLLDAARGAVDRYARTGTDQADLDAVRLALDYAAAVAAAD